MKQVRILVIGDEAVGKTSLIERYVNGTFFLNHSPTVINEYLKCTKYHELQLRDCSSLKEFENIRFLQYAELDVIFFCFNLATIGTLDSLKSKWLPEVNKLGGNAIRILIGCKNDLETTVNERLIIKMQDLLKISKFVKCSAKRNEHIDAVFGSAMNALHQHNRLSLSTTKSTKRNRKTMRI